MTLVVVASAQSSSSLPSDSINSVLKPMELKLCLSFAPSLGMGAVAESWRCEQFLLEIERIRVLFVLFCFFPRGMDVII